MNKKQKQLIFALILGSVVLFGNKSYLDSRISQYRNQKMVAVVSANQLLKAGDVLRSSMVQKQLVPEIHAPRARIGWSALNQFLGQELSTDVLEGDYVLQNNFRTIGTVGATLSEQLEREGFRAITLPVDETNSLARSIVTGDKIDIIFTFNAPPLQQKVSMVLLQNVSVIATGSYSVSEQELGVRAGRLKRYNTLTLRASAEDALRLNYARQEGQISLLLRSPRDNSDLEINPIGSVLALLNTEQQSALKEMQDKQQVASRAEGERFKEQIKALMELQRSQKRK